MKVGGLALFEARIFNTPYSIGAGFFSGQSPGALTTLGAVAAAGTPAVLVGGGLGVTGAMRNARARDNYGLGALGRVELDAGTATGYGTLRAFIRVDSSARARPHRRARSTSSTTPPAGPFPAKEQTIVNKASFSSPA